jgi:PEP-CTERM motif
MILTWLNRSSGTGSAAFRRGQYLDGADKRRRGRQRCECVAEKWSEFRRGGGRDLADDTTSVMRSRSRLVRVGVIVLPLLVCLAAPSRASTISLGLLSFDQFIPADPANSIFVGTNAFNIFNSTADFANPFDPGTPPNPITPVSFDDASLLLTKSNGDIVNVPIGTIAPGLLTDATGNPLFALQFADTEAFVSAVFTATLSVQDFLFADGSTFHAATPNLLYTLGSLSGSLLANPLPPSDPLASLTAVSFDLTGDLVPPQTAVPEPPTLALFGAGLALLLFRRVRAPAARRR